MELHCFNDTSLLNTRLAKQIQRHLEHAIEQRGQAYFVVSGGKTPIELFRVLSFTKLPWEKVTITLADERCVAATNSERNEQLVKDYLLQNQAQQAQFISLFDETISLRKNLENTVRLFTTLPTFDVVLLGMGEDGHTASLFPCSKEVNEGLDEHAAPVLLVAPKTAPYQRMSLSKKRLLDSRIIFLHLVGEKKQAAFNQALADKDPVVMPVRAFIHEKNTNVHVMYAPS